MSAAAALIPVTLLTGFLGSGKTSTLNALVRQPEMARTLVIINEFGQVGLDHLLVTHCTDDVVVEMSSGCLCCTIRGDLVKTLRDAVWRFSREGVRQFDRVVIETTGLADPAPVLHTLMRDQFVSGKYRLDGVVTTVDLASGMSTLDAHPEAVKQVAVADVLLLTKSDIADLRTVQLLMDRLSLINPGAFKYTALNGIVSSRQVTNLGLFSMEGKAPDVGRWLRAESYALQRHGQEMGHDHDHDHDHDHGHDQDQDQDQDQDHGHGRGHGHGHGHGNGHGHGHAQHAKHSHVHATGLADDERHHGSRECVHTAGEHEADGHHDVNRHDDHIRAFCFSVDALIDPLMLEVWLDTVLSLMGPDMLRMKAVLNVQGEELPVVLHGVQHILHPPAKLPAWPSGDRRSHWVFITRNIDRSLIEQSLRSFMAEPAAAVHVRAVAA